jgi:hypothetical protein
MNNIDKEYQMLFEPILGNGDVYKNYEKITNDFQLENPIDDFIIKTIKGEMIKVQTEYGDDYRILTQEEFTNKCITDSEFSKKWGVTIYTEVDDDIVWMGIVYNNKAVKVRIK